VLSILVRIHREEEKERKRQSKSYKEQMKYTRRSEKVISVLMRDTIEPFV
jgi:Tat protein secretion system quality control protein TatD with DNase activity